MTSGILNNIATLLEESRTVPHDQQVLLSPTLQIRNISRNHLYACDNLMAMQHLLQSAGPEILDLIYVDPPFESSRNYYLTGTDKILAYQDRWKDGLEGYLRFMTPRLILMHQLLKDTGSLYVHVDCRVSHYLKIICDDIFGREQFRNEIIWQRDSAGKGAKGSARQWSRENDHILVYGKTDKPYHQSIYRDTLTSTQLREYLYQDPDGRRFKKVQLGDYTGQSIEKLRQENRIYRTSSGREYKKYYLEEARFAIGSNWCDIVNLSKGQLEQVGYPTQKPLKLLERIIQASCPEGGMIGDFFAGAGTTAMAAENLNCRWILAEQSASGDAKASGKSSLV